MTRPGPGKFEGNESLEISELLHDIVSDGWFDDQLGDVETFGWHALITDVKALSHYDMHWPIKDVKDAYIVSEDNYGFFTYKEFELKTHAWNFWKGLTQEYLEFVNIGDEVTVL